MLPATQGLAHVPLGADQSAGPAGRAVGERRRTAADERIAGVGGADVAVVAVRAACPGVQAPAWQVSAPLQTVAVGAGGAVRAPSRCAQPSRRVAGVGRAGVAVVAVERRAGRADARSGRSRRRCRRCRRRRTCRWPRCRAGSRRRRAAVGRAGVAVVAVERRLRRRRRRPGRSRPVADVASPQPLPFGNRSVDAAARRVAGVGGADVAVVAVEGVPRGTDPGLAGLGAVADVGVRARGAVRHGRVLAARRALHSVGRAGVAVVAAARSRCTTGSLGSACCVQPLTALQASVVQALPSLQSSGVPGGAGAALAGLAPVADVAVAARACRSPPACAGSPAPGRSCRSCRRCRRRSSGPCRRAARRPGRSRRRCRRCRRCTTCRWRPPC